MATLERDDVTIHYRIDGAHDAPPLLISNSLGTDLEMWAPQIGVLSENFRVVRYDTRGHGASSVPEGPYTIEQLGRDALAVLDAVGVERVCFIGLSMGGLTGLWLALNAPNRIDRMVLANTGAKIGNDEFWNARIESIRDSVRDSMRDVGVASLPDAIVDAVVERWFTKRYRAIAPQSVARIRRMLVETSSAGYAANCAAIRDADLRAGLASIRIPTLVIAGTHDPSTPPALGREIADAIPDARYLEFDAAHLSNLEQAGALNAAVVHFLHEGRVTERERLQVGETMRRSVLGDAHVDRSIASRSDFNGEFVDYITRTAWG